MMKFRLHPFLVIWSTMRIVSDNAIERRNYWINEIRNLSGNFSDDYDRLEAELINETKLFGATVLIDHLRLCGSIPESYIPSSSEEKLYSKYTDCLLSLAYQAVGLRSIVLTERGGAADVEVFADDYSFVADAKAFRLSRTAKNQKDFKVPNVNVWKRGKPYAMVVCPIYQLPRRESQIYQSAAASNVCIFTYSHLSLLLNFSQQNGTKNTQELILKIFKTITENNPFRDGVDYWLTVNRTLLDYSQDIEEMWINEKLAAMESISIERNLHLLFLAEERERKIRMN